MRLVIAEDSGLLRESLQRILVARGFDVVGIAGDAPSLLAAVRRHEPDVALTDVRMPPTHTDEGVVAALQLRAERPALGVLVLSSYADSESAMALLSKGARGVGYLLKDRVANVHELVDALRRVGRGETAVDPEIVRLLLDRPDDEGLMSLTDREREILALVAEGRSNEAIAGTLFLSGKTVETHMSRIFMKLDLRQATGDNRRVLAVLRYLRA